MAHFLGDALESVLRQSVVPAEVVVVDDGSKDDPKAVVRSVGGPVRLVRANGEGSAVARNLGIFATTSPLVAFLDADDYWLPGMLEAALHKLEEPRFGLAFPDWQHLTERGLGMPVLGSYYSGVAEGSVFSKLLRQNWLLTSSVLVRRSLLARTGVFDPTLIGGQDFELWLRLARLTHFGWIRSCFAVKRAHGGNITGSHAYAYHHVKVWRTIGQRHPDVGPQDRAYIRSRLDEAAYQAGRHALRHGERDLARQYFSEATALRPLSTRHLLWRGASAIPTPVFGVLLRAKRQFVGNTTS